MKACGLLCLVVAGCASHSDSHLQPAPGSGIAEHREVAGQAHRAVAGVVESLDALGGTSASEFRSIGIPASPSPQLARFDKAFNQLELTSVKARARAEAIIARGQNYFDEWEQRLTAATNQPSARTEYERLYDQFTVIRQRSSEVREQFRPFMADLRQFRASVDKPVAADGRTRTLQDEIASLSASGRRVLKSLDSVCGALNEAEAELHAMRLSKR